MPPKNHEESLGRNKNLRETPKTYRSRVPDDELFAQLRRLRGSP
jgi:hypothetical protein